MIGSMNRGGLAGTEFEIDDRFTAYDADADRREAASRAARCCSGSTPRTRPRPPPSTACAEAVDALADARADGHGRAVHLPPRRRAGAQRPVRRGGHPIGDGGGRARRRPRRTPGSSCRSSTDMDEVLAATTLPGAAARRRGRRPTRTRQFARWAKVLRQPARRGHGGRAVPALPAGRRRRRRRRRDGGDAADMSRGRRTTCARAATAHGAVRAGWSTPAAAGWTTAGSPCSSSSPASAVDLDTGDEPRPWSCRCRASCDGQLRRRRDAAGRAARRRLQRRQRLRLRAARRDRDRDERGRRPVRAARRPCATRGCRSATAPAERAGRAARRRAGEPAGQQLLHRRRRSRPTG